MLHFITISCIYYIKKLCLQSLNLAGYQISVCAGELTLNSCFIKYREIIKIKMNK